MMGHLHLIFTTNAGTESFDFLQCKEYTPQSIFYYFFCLFGLFFEAERYFYRASKIIYFVTQERGFARVLYGRSWWRENNVHHTTASGQELQMYYYSYCQRGFFGWYLTFILFFLFSYYFVLALHSIYFDSK